MKKKSLTENFVYNILYQILVTALPILTAPYTVRVLGLHANGNHAYTESIVTYFIVIGFVGTALYGTRKIAYLNGSSDQSNIAQTTWDVVWLRLILMAATLGVYIPALCISNEFAALYRIQIINIVAAGLDLSWFFQGVEDFKKVALRNMLVKLVYVVCLFVFIKSPDDLPLYVFLIVMSSLLGNLLMWFFLREYLGKKSFCWPSRIFFHLRGSVGLFLPQITNYIYSLLDRSMLKWMTGSTDFVTIYDQGQRLLRAIIAIMQSVGYVMMARLSNLQATDNHAEIKRYIHKSLNLTLFFAFPIMFGLGGIAKDFIPLFLGQEYTQVITVLQVLCPLTVMISVNSVLGVQLLLAIGKEKQYTLATTLGATINVVVNLVLLPKLNVLGACISSLCAETAVFIVCYQASKAYIDFGQVVRENALPALSSLAMLGIVWFIQQQSMGIMLRLLVEVVSGMVFYFGVMALTKNEIFNFIFSKVTSRFIHRKGR